MVGRIIGRRVWGGKRDEQGHREYKLTLRIETEDPLDGPAIVQQTPDTPVPGSLWILGNDIDLFAWCHLDMDIKAVVEGEPNTQWDVTWTFSTKPLSKGGDFKGCNGQQMEDPLTIPPRISGSSVRYSEAATKDRKGKPILTYSGELITGQEVEFDRNRSQIVIEQNVLSLQQNLCESLRDKVNSSTLWGYPRRCVKMSDFRFERKYYGTCYIYFTRIFTFDIMLKPDYQLLGGGFDREIISEGRLCLRGRWGNLDSDIGTANQGRWIVDPDVNIYDLDNRNNSSKFQQYKDWNDNFATTVHDAHGLPIGGDVPGGGPPLEAGAVYVEKYDEADFLQLGIPSVIDQYSGI
jgi:hypothetical protein